MATHGRRLTRIDSVDRLECIRHSRLLSEHLFDESEACKRSLPGRLGRVPERNDESRDNGLEVDGVLAILLDVSSEESLGVSESGGFELRGELLQLVEGSGPDGCKEDEGVVSEVGEKGSEEGGGKGRRGERRVDDSVDEVGEVSDLLGGGGLKEAGGRSVRGERDSRVEDSPVRQRRARRPGWES